MSDDTDSKVSSLIKNIVNTRSKTKSQVSEAEDEKPVAQNPKTKTEVIKGKPKSGRFWKSEKERFSSINKTKGIKPDFAKKTALRLELKRTKEMSKQLLAEFKQKEQDKKERRRENIKRTEENRKKAEVVQVITNTAKLKRLRKKQLRFIEKRDTNQQVQANK